MTGGPARTDPASAAGGRWLVADGPVTAQIVGGTGRVTLNCPERRNAVSAAVAGAFHRAVVSLTAAGVRVCVLAAEGTVFCAGADLSEGHLEPGSSPVDQLLADLLDPPMFWIAEVQGGCAGAGVAVALSCPLVVASDEAWLWLPELSRLGVLPIAVIDRLAPLVGLRGALGLAAGERRVTAAEALRAGWVTAVVAGAGLQASARALAERVNSAAPGTLVECRERWAAQMNRPGG